MYGSNGNVPVTFERSAENGTFSFPAGDKPRGETPFSGRSLSPDSAVRPVFVHMEKGTCVQALYNQAQYVENTHSWVNDEYCNVRNKFVIVLDLEQDRNRGDTVYSYENHLVDYYYQSVGCARSVYGVWTFPYGRFTLKPANEDYGEKSCTLKLDDVRE